MSTLEVIPKDMTVNGKRVTVESQTTLVPAPSLEALANVIRHEHGLVERAAQSMLDHAVTCGNALIEAKQRVPKGQWTQWCKDNVPLSQPVVTFYMRVAAHADLLKAANVDTMQAARQFLINERLYLGPAPLSDETVLTINELARRGMSPRTIGRHLGLDHVTVWRHLKREAIRKELRTVTVGRKRGRRRKVEHRTITDDLIEGLAIWMCDGQANLVTDKVRTSAQKALRAAFTYDGPIPGENG